MPRELTDSDRQEFRERLCAVAEGLFAEHGAQDVSIRQIALAMGVSAMTPYRYFTDKDDILAAVRTRAFLHFAEVLELARAGAEADALAAGVAVREAYLDFAFGNENSYRLMFDFAHADEGDYPDLVAAVARARKSMTAFVIDMITAGLIEGDAQQIGAILWSATHGAVVLEMARKLPQGAARSLSADLSQMLLK